MTGGYERFHWRIYNVFRRLFGLGATCGGAVLTLEGLALLLDPQAAVPVNGVPQPGVLPKLLWLLFSLMFVTLGLRFVRTRTYRPDLGDVPWIAAPFEARAQWHERRGEHRSWWTGDPLAD